MKKQQAEERKAKRLEFKEKYGYAEVDGEKLEIANWFSEPSCLFAGRGDHPQRGKWKDGPNEEDIILNLPPDAPVPSGHWKGVVWEPDKITPAKWGRQTHRKNKVRLVLRHSVSQAESGKRKVPESRKPRQTN